jgi:hypothetical protein
MGGTLLGRADYAGTHHEISGYAGELIGGEDGDHPACAPSRAGATDE